MKIRRATCAAVIIGVVVLGAVIYLLYRMLGNKSGGASDPSYALVTSPLDNGIVFLNDPTYVQVSAMLTHRDFSGAKLFVDGEEFALDAAMQSNAPRNTVTCTSEDLRFCGSAALRLLWVPAEAGPHRLSACLLGDEKADAPWKICTDDANVVVTDPSTPLASAGTYQPQPGDSVASVAEKFGLPAILVAAANPGLDVAKALSPDAPVIIPGDPSSAAFGPAPSSSTGPWTVATAGMKTAVPVDKAYCYYSLGADYWTRIPAGPDTFVYPLDGTLDLRPELSGLTIPASAGSLAMECWGWSGATLIPLGSGKTTIVPASSSTVHLDGDQFTLDVTLGSIPGDFETMDKKLVIPPPVDVAETNKADVCIKHGPSDGFESLLWTLFCKAAVEKGVTTLVWDWIRPLFPLDDPKITLATAVDGYHVYMVPAGGKPSLIKTISNPNQKALDLSFLKGMTFLKGFPTFFVRAYIGPLESADSNHFTLRSEASGLATVTLDPSVVHFGGQKKNKTYTGISVCKTGLLLISGSPSIAGDEVAVGYAHEWPEDDCLTYNEEYSRAYFAFDLSSITGPVSSAFLTYRQGGFTSAAGQSCARRLGMITADPSYDLVDLLPLYGTAGTPFTVDVTSEVRNWQAGTPNNGFVFVGADETLPPTCGGLGEPGCIGGSTEGCWTTYAGHQLTVTYFVP